MADDELRQFEAVLGALSKMSSDVPGEDELAGARCPKCEGSSFIKITDLYDEAAGRHGEPGESPDAVRDGGLTDTQILGRFSPPRRRTITTRVLAIALVLGGGVFLVFQRFGKMPAELAGAGAIIIVVMVALTTTRRFSDEYYDKRLRWRKTWMCRSCGQLIRP